MALAVGKSNRNKKCLALALISAWSGLCASEAQAGSDPEVISARVKGFTARAVVCLAAVDHSKNVEVVIYNHGYGVTASRALQYARLKEQLHSGTVLIIPEWQRFPASRKQDQGAFAEPGMADALLRKAFMLPRLKGKSIGSVVILSHSAGYGPSETELYKNSLAEKVRVVALLDSLYDVSGFDPWLKENIRSLSTGEKRFYNIFNDTGARSRSQALKIREFLTEADLPVNALLEDYNNGISLLVPAVYKDKYIIFKYSSYIAKVGTNKLGSHDSIPVVYIAPILRVAANMRQEQ